MEFKADLSKPARGSASGTKSIPPIKIDPPPKIPKPVTQACKKLSDAGFKAWLAGGCVRDTIMGRKPKDWDVVTDAPLDRIRALFPEHLEVGAAFGIIKLPPSGTKTEPVQIDIAIFRREEGYTDYRHPDVVEAGDEASDVARRDFTINAMYLDPEASLVIDHVGGHRDIAAKAIRSVGVASKRFNEDALRILRAVRFAAQLGFKIDKDTATALKKCSPLLREISRERIRDELWKLLESQRPIMGLEAVAQNGLWEHVFGVRRVSLPADLRQLKLSWVPTPLHWLCAMGVTGLLGDPIKEPEEIVERLTEQLKLSNVEKRVMGRILKVYADCDREASRKPTCDPMDWISLAREDKPLMDIVKSFIRRARGVTEKEKQDALALVEQALRWAAKPGSEKLLPNAQALMKEGIKQGPKLGEALRARQWQVFWSTKPA